MNAEERKPGYTVKKLAELAGVTVRTLHLYDEIDLLKPSVRTDAGYRLYGEPELLRLQQILFYKELGFSLQQVAEILDNPGFNLVAALENHRCALQERHDLLNKLLRTIDKTITKLKNGKNMTLEELYDGFPREREAVYRQEAIDKYGEGAVQKSEESLLKMDKQDFEALKQELRNVSTNLAALVQEDPTSPHVQKLVAKHYVLIRKFWGTNGAPDKQREAYAGLGELYVNDERFTKHERDASYPEFAIFLRKAMLHFAKTALAV